MGLSKTIAELAMQKCCRFTNFGDACWGSIHARQYQVFWVFCLYMGSHVIIPRFMVSPGFDQVFDHVLTVYCPACLAINFSSPLPTVWSKCVANLATLLTPTLLFVPNALHTNSNTSLIQQFLARALN